ncbi:hypothetical protein, partial [Desulfopila aestuarii]
MYHFQFTYSARQLVTTNRQQTAIGDVEIVIKILTTVIVGRYFPQQPRIAAVLGIVVRFIHQSY